MRAETRHQLKQDRFSRTTIDVAEATVHWSVEHKNKLIAGIVAAVAIVALGIGGWYYLNQQDLKASSELSQAVRTMGTQLRPANMPPQPDFPSFASAKERATAAQTQLQSDLTIIRIPSRRTSPATSSVFRRSIWGTMQLRKRTSRKLPRCITTTCLDWPISRWLPFIATRAVPRTQSISTRSWQTNLPARLGRSPPN